MLVPQDVIYLYDGSYDGALCCIFEAFRAHQRPRQIWAEDEAQPTLCETKRIWTDKEKANRVAAVLAPKISRRAEETVESLYWCAVPQKELLMLDFVALGLEQGARVTTMLGDPMVASVAEAVKQLYKEAHNYKGFVRFSVHDYALTAEIEPKNFVLPLLRSHFCARYRNETFLIYDKTHKAALVYYQGKSQILPLEQLELPTPDAAEQEIRALYRQFFKTIAIEARKNPRCQMSHVPKRYWAQMLELREENGLPPPQETPKSLEQKNAGRCLQTSEIESRLT